MYYIKHCKHLLFFVTDKIPAVTDHRSTQPDLFPLTTKHQILRIEKNLSTIGVFTPRLTRPKELSKLVSTIIRLPDGERAEARVKIIANQECGLPITADQDKFYAFTKILENTRHSHAALRNPITFSYAHMVKLLRRKKNGNTHREIDEWLIRMKSTVIMSTGMIWLAGRKRYSTDAFSIFDRVIGVGEELENGEKAGQIHVYLSSWLLENFENNYVLPIDYEIYREMRLPVAKALVPLLQVWFYATRGNKKTTIEKRFHELCELLGIRYYSHLSRIEQNMENSLNELKQYKLIRFWEFQRTADGKDFKLVLAPGDRFITQRHAKVICGPNSVETKEFEHLLSELTKRGVHEQIARELLYNATDLTSVRMRIAYVDSEISRRLRSRNPIKNPPGFYKWCIENEAPVPDTFVSEATAAKVGDLQNQYCNYRYWETEKYFKTHFTPDQQKQKLDDVKFRLRKESDDWSYMPTNLLDCMIYNQALREIEPEVDLLTYDQFCQNNQLRLTL
jgi:hypothetical protein